MRIQPNPDGKNPEPEAVVSEVVCSAEFAQGCVEPLEDASTDQVAGAKAQEIHFSETVCSAEFKGGCLDPTDEEDA